MKPTDLSADLLKWSVEDLRMKPTVGLALATASMRNPWDPSGINLNKDRKLNGL
jgi:hypothetical protein